LYKLEGLKEHLQVNSYETFIKTTINNSLSSPIYFDEDVEKFIEVFVPANNYILFEKFISESKYLVDEDKYLGAYKLLTFLNKHNSINESIVTYSQLKNYFSLKQKLTSLNDQVFFVEKQELSSFISEVYKIGEDLKALTIEKNLLYNIFLPLLKALNSKLENILEKVPVADENFENLSFSFNEQINTEILKLQMHITRIENLPAVPVSVTATLVEQATDSQEASVRRIFVYFLLSILGALFIIFLYFELYPSYSKINFLCTLKLGKYATHLAEKLILKNPEDYKAFLILAKSYEVAGKYNASINAYKTALKLKDKTKEGE
jgi:tetratricopeptide (TPR) repeat protein